MRLSDARGILLSKISDGRPTMAIPYPDKVLDFHIFAAASQLMQEYRMATGNPDDIEDWMLTRLECQTVLLDNPSCLIPKICETRFKVDLPAKPLEVEHPIQSVYITSSLILVGYLSQSLIPMMKHREVPVSRNSPVYTMVSDGESHWINIYAGTRDLVGCPVTIHYLAGEAIPASTCAEPTTSIAVPPGGAVRMMEIAMASLLSSENKKADLVNDGLDETQIRQ